MLVFVIRCLSVVLIILWPIFCFSQFNAEDCFPVENGKRKIYKGVEIKSDAKVIFNAFQKILEIDFDHANMQLNDSLNEVRFNAVSGYEYKQSFVTYCDFLLFTTTLKATDDGYSILIDSFAFYSFVPDKMIKYFRQSTLEEYSLFGHYDRPKLLSEWNSNKSVKQLTIDEYVYNTEFLDDKLRKRYTERLEHLYYNLSEYLNYAVSRINKEIKHPGSL